MDLDSIQINACAPGGSSATAQALATACTLTLQLPAAAQASSPGERPLGSVVKIEIDGKPVTEHDVPVRAPLANLRPALLTLTF